MLSSWSSRRTFAVLAAGCLASVTGCGGSSAGHTSDASPATRPAGASAQVVRYHCLAGRRDTISVSLPDPRRLAEVLNPINVCEFDGGLADVSIALQCTAGVPAREVRIVAVHGQLPPSTARTACD